MTISISVQAGPLGANSWPDLATEVEGAGFDALVVGDHPGTNPSPFVALAAAAGVTEHIGLGTCVVNAGMWEPLGLAAEVATLDVVSGGRARLGIGAGHTSAEWTMQGRTVPDPAERVRHLIDLVDATMRLLGGRTVSMSTNSFTIVDARLDHPRPVQSPIPLLVGGNGDRVLTFAAARADVVGITGLGLTLADGHHHDVDWSPTGLRRIVDRVREAAEPTRPTPSLDAMVQHVQITDDAAATAAELAPHIPGSTEADLLWSPFVWLGTVDEIRLSLHSHRAEFGIDRYTIRSTAMPAVREIMATPV